ncbi:hypothetical protein K491DRAFT_635379 [Lophiostoma macrostomum CBS 122681]|uniref:Altered inheritance of mitochondria protein 6 n=1 Tax=Lophiostoma macrostomum CBS 122681 TaxID=1314788 RepID=A0A6A6T159_9PLEO|nr:hypothetical protein K491DRAFT_635379 [Lophiostoma macrostomum CBS 122681]
MKTTFAAAAAAFSSATYAATLQKREGISSCGSDWMAVNDVKTNHGAISRVGYNSAVNNFCNKAGGQTVPGNQYLTMATRIWADYGGDPTTTGLNEYVYFEIHNKLGSSHAVNAANCKTYLTTLSVSNSKCYGPDHQDTKGGTYQIGNSDVSYHALANKAPLDANAVDKTLIGGSAVATLGNGGKGNTLRPFPIDSFNDAVPVSCHSHNDYDRDYSLYSALEAGCISVEADVWPHGDKLTVGHTDPGANAATIQDLYLDPIKQLLDAHGGIFPTKIGQPFYLLVDFKGDASTTWDLLVKALQPLRDAGYLSHYDGSFKQGKLTVIGSGNAVVNGDKPAPIAKVNDASANPGRSIFVDAIIYKDMSNFDKSNTVYASANWGDSGASDSNKLNSQIKAAHDKGFLVRYYDISTNPSDWQTLFNAGVDRINVDNLQDVAAVDWHL